MQRGFTLIELAIGVAIVGLLMMGAMFTLEAQLDQRSYETTRARLSQARDLLLAHAVVNGRLPCPAVLTINPGPPPAVTTFGDEAPAGGVGCTNPYGGFLPARTIGFEATDAQGYALDAWGNRIRYAVSNVLLASAACTAANHFTVAANLKSNGVTCRPDDLLVCRSATGITATACGGMANQVMSANTVVAVVWSTGKTGASGTTGASVSLGPDETANLNGDRVFVFHTPAPSFDDQFTWLTAGELYNRLIAAGVLP